MRRMRSICFERQRLSSAARGTSFHLNLSSCTISSGSSSARQHLPHHYLKSKASELLGVRSPGAGTSGTVVYKRTFVQIGVIEAGGSGEKGICSRLQILIRGKGRDRYAIVTRQFLQPQQFLSLSLSL